MRYASLDDFLDRGRKALAKGPLAMILVEDDVEVESTLTHHLNLGFAQIVVLVPKELPVTQDDLDPRLHVVTYDTFAQGALERAVNRVIEAAPGTWIYYGYNAEYLFYPFCETRNVRELVTFHSEERRSAFLTYVIDLYAGDLGQYPNAVSRPEALLDRSGYYAQGRPVPGQTGGQMKERQLDFFGGIRWRFEEHIPPARRKIDRIALFRAQPGLQLRDDYTFNDEEMNTYSCPWHHNITVAVTSFRTAKALCTNPGSKFDIKEFRWMNSVPFTWHSQQLMDLGLMEPGQWF